MKLGTFIVLFIACLAIVGGMLAFWTVFALIIKLSIVALILAGGIWVYVKLFRKNKNEVGS